ncbi:phosphoglycolate phosphatase [Rhodanobacter denitrificans]|uniref:Phosphoglycolate phosphatase n=1 Tax=Rhodanobacter denitrificans TaxID=666685 RepID=M4NFF7_9GAMM|nr:phosphoglycolate phosphatase [Rhodanobacter denitrificans]AGG88348.1 2-phosphoglycolate phosphatase [Rhodanobacter denitrificans]UJJ58973.1 phosphoglycolate phosphatase [Rhodanobacter denitrificans]UJM87489.1 phosphoglycolate phosphatase [Rhodanobacter denitrificans]
MKPLPGNIQGVLFDLDGTLLDSAPDLYAALQVQCAEEGVPPPPYAPVREVVSRGARAVLRCAFADRGEDGLVALVPRYLQLYQDVMVRQTRAFEGIDELLARIEAHGLRWGIVTNKAGFLADELVVRIGWAGRVDAVVCGDTLAVKKPDPAPVLLACERAGVAPAQSLFVGDDRRDVQAGAAAGLYTVAVSWGYLDGGDPHTWGADAVLDHPAELAELLKLQPVSA